MLDFSVRKSWLVLTPGQYGVSTVVTLRTEFLNSISECHFLRQCSLLRPEPALSLGVTAIIV